MISAIITGHFLFFAMLFMQHWVNLMVLPVRLNEIQLNFDSIKSDFGDLQLVFND